MAKTTGDLLDDIISAEFAEAKDLSKEDSTVKGWIDSLLHEKRPPNIREVFSRFCISGDSLV